MPLVSSTRNSQPTNPALIPSAVRRDDRVMPVGAEPVPADVMVGCYNPQDVRGVQGRGGAEGSVELVEKTEVADAVVEGSDERESFTWSEFGDASRELAQKIVDDGFVPDVVVAIARGGLLLAGSVAYALGIKACGALNVEFYTGIGERLPEPVVLPPMLDEASLGTKKVLLVDDVSDSGRTLALVTKRLEATGAEVRTVCLYTKPQTVLEPHFFWRRTDRWINFPWSVLPPVTPTVD
jgi:hypoxanthine phosphoribosyltransferase